MVRRVIIAVGVLAAVAGLLVARHEGYLGGRVDGGPLLFGTGLELRPPAGRRVIFGLSFDADRSVVIDDVSVDATPGLQIAGPRWYPRNLHIGGVDGGLPAGGRPLNGWHRKATRAYPAVALPSVIVSARATIPGRYLLRHVRVRYHAGRRGYARDDALTVFCVSGRGMLCRDHDFATSGELDRGVVQEEGYLHMTAPHVDARGVPGPDVAAVTVGGAPGTELVATWTLSNRDDDAHTITRLTDGVPRRFSDLRDVRFAVQRDPRSYAGPTAMRPLRPFTIPAHQMRVVQMRATFGDDRCSRRAGSYTTGEQLRARIDGRDVTVRMTDPIAIEHGVCGPDRQAPDPVARRP